MKLKQNTTIPVCSRSSISYRPIYLELFVSFAFFYGVSFLLFLLARRMQKIGYSFGFFIANLIRLRQILPIRMPLGFFNFLFIFSMLFLFFIKNFIGGGIKVGYCLAIKAMLY